jgi:predicted permease
MDMDHVRVDRAAGTRLYATVTERLSALPGVIEVGLARDLPLRSRGTVMVLADAAPARSDTGQVAAAPMVVSSRYFRTLGLSILQGRAFEDGEAPRPRMAIVSETMARRLWPDGSPLGRTFRVDRVNAEPLEVIGVATDAVAGRLGERPPAEFYQPFPHEYRARMTLILRVQGDAASVFPDVRRTVGEVNRDLSVVDLRTMDDVLGNLAEQRRVPATAVTLAGLLGLLLSAIGLYGVIAYGVRERARELGIRLALGARPADVRRLVLREGFALVAIGLGLGAAGTIVLARLARSTVFGAGPIDAAVLVAVCAVLTATGFAALYVPARWASRIEPAHTLRNE